MASTAEPGKADPSAQPAKPTDGKGEGGVAYAETPDTSCPSAEPAKPTKGKGKGKGAPPPPKVQSAEERDKVRLEAAKKREEEKREREEQQAVQRLDNEAREALKARLPKMKGLDVLGIIPWLSANMTVKLAGGRQDSSARDAIGVRRQSGVTAVQLEGDRIVCFRCVPEIVSEYFAESMAIALEVPVARSRLVRPDEDEYAQVDGMLKRCSANMGWGEIKDFQNPDSPVMANLKETNPEGWESITKMLGHRTTFAVLEFIAGLRLDGCDNQLLAFAPDVAWTALGKLCALDVLLNNMDRLPLPVFHNSKGNLGNVMVNLEGPTIIGIDQQVNVIHDRAGCQNYLNNVQSLVQQLIEAGPAVAPGGDDHPFGPEAITTHIRVSLQNCCKELSHASATLLLSSMRSTFFDIAKAWDSGWLTEVLSAAEMSGAERIVDGQMYWQDGRWSAPVIDSTPNIAAVTACAEFLRKVARAISEVVSSCA